MAVIVFIFVIGLLAVADKLAHCVKDVTFQLYVGVALNGPLILVEHLQRGLFSSLVLSSQDGILRR